MKIATILFTYNRPWHTERVIKALAKNTVLPEQLFIFHDGLKKEEHRTEWLLVKELILRVDFCSVNVIESKENKGLAKSIVEGINYVFEKYDAVIVLEDDCIPAVGFMAFMQDAFYKYQNSQRVYCISGYSWPMDLKKDEFDAYFTGRISSWGWGTWKDRWQQYEMDNCILDNVMSNVAGSRNLATWGKDLDVMFRDRLKGKNDSWAVYFALLVIKNDGLCLAPYDALIQNIGFDGSGVHCDTNPKYEIQLSHENKDHFVLPNKLEIRENVKQAFCKLYGSSLVNQKYFVNKENVILYGLGGNFHEYENVFSEKYNIVTIADGRKCGFYAGIEIISPERISKYEYDKIIVTLIDYDEVQKVRYTLVNKYAIEEKKIFWWKECGICTAD